MRQLILLAVSLLLVACSTGVGSPVPQSAPRSSASPFDKYIIVGDSLMAYSADGELTTTASLLLLEEQKPVVNISLGGQSMAGSNGNSGAEKDHVGGAINYLTAHGKKPWNDSPGTAVIIELGHNDWFFAATSQDDLYASYVRFLQSIDNLENQVTVFCVVPVAAKWDYTDKRNASGVSYEQLRDVVRRVAQTGWCNLVETSGWFTQADVFNTQIMPDGLHLAAGGHRIYKDRLLQSLRQYAKQVSPKP